MNFDDFKKLMDKFIEDVASGGGQIVRRDHTVNAMGDMWSFSVQV